jgi:hypothetical protein
MNQIPANYLQIIWLNWGLTDSDMTTLPAGVHRGFLKDILHSTTSSIRPYTGLGSDLGGTKGRCLFAGSWNADIYPTPQSARPTVRSALREE